MRSKLSYRFFGLLLLCLLTFGASNSVAGPSDEAKSRSMDYFIRGTIADQMQDYYRAIFHYQEALRIDSSSCFIYVALAQDYILLENVGEAESLLKRALAQNPDFIPALELKTMLMHGLNRLPEAKECVERLVKVAPKETKYLKQLLALYLLENKFDKAEDLFSEIIKREGETPQLLRQMLSVYLVSEKYDKAVPFLEKLIAQDTTDAALVYTLGSVCLQKGDTIKAEQLFYRANIMSPTEPRFWLSRAATAFDRRNFDSTIVIVQQALTQVGDNAPLYGILGTTQYRLGRIPEAVVSLNKAIDMDSTMFAAMGTLALIYDGLDSLDRVVDLYEKAIRLTDSAAVYLNNLAYTYAERGIHLDVAKELSKRALNAEPKNASYLDTMGWIEFKNGDFDEALHWLKKAVKVDSKSAPLYEHIGDVYQKMGSQSKATSYYKKAIELDPTNNTLRAKSGQ